MDIKKAFYYAGGFISIFVLWTYVNTFVVWQWEQDKLEENWEARFIEQDKKFADEIEKLDEKYATKYREFLVLFTEHLISEEDNAICYWSFIESKNPEKIAEKEKCEAEKRRFGIQRLLKRLQE